MSYNMKSETFFTMFANIGLPIIFCCLSFPVAESSTVHSSYSTVNSDAQILLNWCCVISKSYGY